MVKICEACRWDDALGGAPECADGRGYCKCVACTKIKAAFIPGGNDESGPPLVGLNLQVRPVKDEDLDDLGLAVVRGPHQRCPAAVGLVVDLGVEGNQLLDHRQVTRPRCSDNGCRMREKTFSN